MPQAGGAAGLSVTPQGTGLQGMNVGVNPSVNPLPVATPGFSSAEESALLLEVNRIKNQAAVEAGTMPPLPRHPLSSDVQGLLADPAPAATPAPVMALPLPPGGARQYPPQ
jgi:hypothetical protein